MAAKKGNKYALGNKGGKPPIVSKDDRPTLFKEMLDDFQNHLDNFDQNKSPIFIENWCRKHNLSDQTLRNYLEANEEFLATYNKCKQIQKEILIQGGLKGYFNPTAFIFTAKNITDMRDKVETDLTSGGKELKGLIYLPARQK